MQTLHEIGIPLSNYVPLYASKSKMLQFPVVHRPPQIKPGAKKVITTHAGFMVDNGVIKNIPIADFHK